MQRATAKKKSILHKIAPSQTLLIITALSALALSLVAGSVRDSSREAQKSLFDAKKDFHRSIGETRLQLASMLNEAGGEKSLLQNMGWGYSNSVTQTLQSRLRIGELEQLEIFDANCKSIARVHLRASLPVSCSDNSPVGQFSWTQNSVDKSAVLILAIAFGEAQKGPYKLVGAVNLGEQWLPIHSELKNQMTRSGLKIAISSEDIPDLRILASESLDQTGRPLARLAAMDNLTVTWLGRKEVAETARRTQSICLLFAIGLLALVWIRQKRHMSILATEHHEFGAWLSSFSADSAVSRTNLAFINTSLSWKAEYSDYKNLVLSMQLKLADEKSVAEREREEIATLLASRDDDLLRSRQRLAELSELNTLGEQLKRTTRSFAEHVHNVRDAFEDLQSILSSGLRHESKQLVALADRWVAGLRERGSRKFIRSLAETAGTSVDNSALDDEINNLQTTSQAITDLALNAAMHAQKLVQSVDHTAEVAALWDKLAHRDPSEASHASWADVLAGLQRLMKMDAKLAPLKISDYIAETESSALPKLPATVWTSTLYHACLAAFDSRWLEQKSVNPTIAFRIRQTPTRSILVISVRLPDNTPLLSMSAEQIYHLDVAQALLEPYGIEAMPMAVVRGAAPIAISWSPSISMGAPESLLKSNNSRPKNSEFIR